MQLHDLSSVLVIAPHADDEVLGCGGLLASLRDNAVPVHVMFAAVDGSRHYGLDEATSFQERIGEIDAVAGFLGFDYSIVYGDQDLMERLDTVAKRDLVDRFERAMNDIEPDLLLLPSGEDYDQDHVAVFETAFAASRPIAPAFGKWLAPNVLTYEATKLNWASRPLTPPRAFVDISNHLDDKIEALRRYASQLRPSPHIRSEESVRALASVRGSEVGVAHAEAFGVLRMVLA